MIYQSREKKNTDMIVMISGETHSYEVWITNFDVGIVEIISTNTMVIHGNPLGFDLLVSIDAIKVLGGISISWFSEVKFLCKKM